MTGANRNRRGGRVPGRRRRTSVDDAAGASTASERGEKPSYARRSLAALPLWNWRTFPVAFAFVLGMVVMALATTVGPLFLVLFFAALFGLAFGLAHILTRTIASRRRQ